MKNHLLLFVAAFAVGCVTALAARTAWFKPQVPHASPHTAPAYAQMVNNTAAPEPAKPVNTVCTICGMDVDPTIKPATYQGKLIGFGCRMCPPKFTADPERYGPSALENKVLSE